MARKDKMSNSPTASALLRTYRDRIDRLEDQKAEIATDIKDIYQEAKSNGFDPKALRAIVKEHRQTQTQRAAARETEALVDIYRASLGMLDGTPLGEAARRRFDEDLNVDDPQLGATRDDGNQEQPTPGDEHGESAAPEPVAETEEGARNRGRDDHGSGRRVTENPYPAGSRLRAAWDEGWCESDGSDGMNMPEAFRRKPAPKDVPEREDA